MVSVQHLWRARRSGRAGRSLSVLLGLGLLGAGGAASADAASTPATATGPAAVAAVATKSCSLAGKYEKLGPTYVETLKVSGTTCDTGVSVVRDYNTCRVHAGGLKGHCTKPVLGFRCSERRTTSPVEFIGVVSCTKSRESVKFSYTQST